jgi:hypothetical protein
VSFSFKKKKLGVGYFLKIVILFFIVTILTWYGKFGKTSLFSSSNNLVITGNRHNSTLYLINQSGKMEKVTSIHCSGNMVQIPQRFNPPDQWSAIFLTFTQKIPFNVPPAKIIGIDSITSLIPFPKNWPEVQHSFSATGDDLRISSMEMDSTLKNSYFCLWKNCTILILYDSNTLYAKKMLSELHEKIDVMIIYNTSAQSTVSLRSVVRPIYTIAFCSQEEDHFPRFSNLFTVSTDEVESYYFKKDKNRTITLINE